MSSGCTRSPADAPGTSSTTRWRGRRRDSSARCPSPPVRADTLTGLAAAIGVPHGALKGTVARWNAFLSGGAVRDPDFGRVVLPPGRRRCVSAPFTAVPMVEGVNFCCGGFRVTSSLQVVDVFGAAIPGLFAAGDCVGGLNPVADLGGIHICGGFTLGRVAGRAAARGVEDRGGHGSVLHARMPSMLDTRLALVHLDPTAERA